MRSGARGTAAALVLMLATAAAAQERVSRGEAEFLREAAESSLAEVELAKLARSKATRAEVQQFAERMEREHTATYRAIEEIAASKRVRIPSSPDEDALEDVRDLEEKMGPDFDRAYMRHMLEEHRDDIEDFERQARRAKDPTSRRSRARRSSPCAATKTPRARRSTRRSGRSARATARRAPAAAERRGGRGRAGDKIAP